MNDFHDLSQAEEKKLKTIREVLFDTGQLDAPKKYKVLYSFTGTVSELKIKLGI